MGTYMVADWVVAELVGESVCNLWHGASEFKMLCYAVLRARVCEMKWRATWLYLCKKM